MNGVVSALALQPDNMLLVATRTGRVLRLKPDGSPDPGWHGGTPLQMGGRIDHLALLPDGRVLISGYPMYPGSYTDPDTGDLVPVTRNVVRLNSDGSVDESFVIEALYNYDASFSDDVIGFALQSDGSIIIFGVFDQVTDGYGTVIYRDYVARITPEGRLDTGFDLGAFSFASGTPISQVETINLGPDGKFLIGGDFTDQNGRSKLGRYANGWSFEDLSVSDTGDTVTWLRSGTSPELWRVSFEYSPDPDAATPVWVPLGRGNRVAGGWRLDGVNLAQYGTRVNGYVRARGYVTGDHGTIGSLVESLRLYYLKPQKTTITVTAHGQSKTYGQADPSLGYSFDPPLNGSDQFTGALSRVAGEDVGGYAITVGTLALGSAYDLVFSGASLTINQAPLLISADNQVKTAGNGNPQFTATCTGLAPWDTAASLGGAPLLTTSVDAGTPRGSYPIHAALGSITSANYRYSFVDGTFTVTGRPQGITFAEPPPKVYGAPAFAAGASASSGLTVSYASSNPAVAVVVGAEVRVTGAGSTVITASQGGDGFWEPAPSVPVTLTVVKAPLHVVAEDKTRAYLTSNPELTVAYQGFVNGEGGAVLTGAPVLATPAVLSSPVGSYAIVAGTGTLQAANYQLVPVNGTLTVYRSCQEITFPAIPERTFGDPPFEIVASACSGLPLSFRSSNPEVARVDGNVVIITGAGSVMIMASQAGSGNLETALEKSQPFVVHRSGQQVSFSSPAQKVVGDLHFDLDGSATSGLPLSYLSSDSAVATVAGSTVTVVGAGTTVLSALQEGSGNYLAALPVSRTLTVAQEGTPPQLYLSTLNSGASTSNPVLNIMGRAADVSGIASLSVAGVERGADAALFSAAATLADGDNAITVTARDGAGNVTTHNFIVTLDPLAPVLALTSPADNSVTDAVSCPVTGTVTPGSTVTMAVNGDALQLLPVSGGSFTGSALLAPGVNTVELTAERDGRSSRSKRSVTFDPAAPALAIGEPAQDLRTEAEAVTIQGTVGSAAEGVQVEAGGALYTPDVVAGAFRQQLALALGENRIAVRAASVDGATSVAHRNLVRIERISGDLGGNGSVDIHDALQLLRISLGSEPASAAALAHGDLAPVVNGVSRPDGVIDVGDLLVLLRRIVGLHL
ncbi:MBG domain-containing protein [Geomonas agri]|uniref:MBG domain-containing protein n=1 Tax=Geomonas agri TaxID=2873702 RepID=UPI001CD5BB48|nr:MBG domain-containing protein [Geomonas agri]